MAKLVVIHCSDSPNHMEFTAADIHKWHQEKGWSGIGYHYVITRSGQPETGRPEYWTGAHVKGHNKDSIGICMIGRDKFTWRQFKTLFDELIPQLEKRYGELNIKGHYEFEKGKTCPNFSPLEAYKRWKESRAVLEANLYEDTKTEKAPS